MCNIKHIVDRKKVVLSEKPFTAIVKFHITQLFGIFFNITGTPWPFSFNIFYISHRRVSAVFIKNL